MNVALNKGGYESFENVMKKGNNPLSVEDFRNDSRRNRCFNFRHQKRWDFHQGFVPQSINIGLKGDFAPWVGNMIVDVQQPILLVCDSGTEEKPLPDFLEWVLIMF